ncbi:MAG: hypothetical protein ABIJ61_05390, partial [bacterium]
DATTIRYVNYFGGVVEIICYYELERMGDINLNGIDNEIADLILYSRYFLQGDSVFTINKPEQILASDVNSDGYYLTIGDLDYLARIITGDALPYPHLKPFGEAVSARFTNGQLTTESSAEIGAIWAQFNVTGDYAIQNHTEMTIESNLQDDVLNVLVWCGTTNYDFTKSISSGNSDIFTISGGGEPRLLYLEASDYEGNLMTVTVQTAEGVITFTPERKEW